VDAGELKNYFPLIHKATLTRDIKTGTFTSGPITTTNTLIEFILKILIPTRLLVNIIPV